MSKKRRHNESDYIAYVLDKDGCPLMPMSSPARVRKKLKSGKAVIVDYEPFTIQLTYDLETEAAASELILGIDPGGDNIAVSVIDENARPLFLSKVRTRNQQIPELMSKRATHRHYRRSKEKAKRNRREVREAKKRGEPNPGIRRIHRLLPGCEEPVICHVTTNTEARFNNRKRPDGWLTPTANQLLLTHLNLVKTVMRFLPVGTVSIEVNKFDIALMLADGDRDKVDYRHGPLSGYEGAEDAIFDQQSGICLLCGKNAIEHYHHIVQQRGDGADTVGNIAGLCSKCHDKVHKDEKARAKLVALKAGAAKKYRIASTLNQIMQRLIKEMAELGVKVNLTCGHETKALRKELGLPKDHHIDAWCIACAALGEIPETVPKAFSGAVRHDIMQFRCHDRQRTRRVTDRKYYLDGVMVARNRHRRTGQDKEKDICLSEFAAQYPEDVSRLTVKPATHTYNDLARFLPGTVFLYENKRFVSFGCQSNGKRFTSPLLEKGYVSTKECQVVRSNAGLVFIGVTLDELDAAREELKENRTTRKKARAEAEQKNVSDNNSENQEGGYADTE